jgi:hypothetical protein
MQSFITDAGYKNARIKKPQERQNVAVLMYTLHAS